MSKGGKPQNKDLKVDYSNHETSKKNLNVYLFALYSLTLTKVSNNDKTSQIHIKHIFNILYNTQYYSII